METFSFFLFFLDYFSILHECKDKRIKSRISFKKVKATTVLYSQPIMNIKSSSLFSCKDKAIYFLKIWHGFSHKHCINITYCFSCSSNDSHRAAPNKHWKPVIINMMKLSVRRASSCPTMENLQDKLCFCLYFWREVKKKQLLYSCYKVNGNRK